jgi:hypothetical protein
MRARKKDPPRRPPTDLAPQARVRYAGAGVVNNQGAGDRQEGRDVLTFNRCRDLLWQRVLRFTYVYEEGDGYVVRLCGHEKGDFCGYGVRLTATRIAHLHPDGSVTLYAGLRRTALKKARLNRLFNAGIYQRRFVWYVQGVPFRDGTRLMPGGRVDLLSALGITGCPIDPAAPAIAADWLEEHGREQEAAALREYLRKTAAG